jgi:hypothetical protein
VKKRAVFEQFIYIYKRSFCQDRLGTNIGKALKKRCRISDSRLVRVVVNKLEKAKQKEVRAENGLVCDAAL